MWLLPFLAAALTVASSCRRDDRSPSSAPPPAQEGELRLVQEPPASLDPTRVESVYEALPVNQIFDGLVDLDSGLDLVPALARAWTVSDEGRTYTFELRPGVRFHDGTPFTSEDVVFTFRRLLKPGRRPRSLVSTYLADLVGAEAFSSGRVRTLTGVEALDPLTVRIRLARRYASFLEVLAMDGLRIVPRAAVERMGDARFSRRPVGTGPFRLLDWNPDRLVLEANPSYFGGRPLLDRVEVRFLDHADTDGGVERLTRAEVHALEVPGTELARVASRPEIRVLRYPEMSLAFLGLDTRSPPLNDERVRQAIAHALDRDRLAALDAGAVRPAFGILSPGVTGYTPQVRTLSLDPDLARRLLAEAGHPDGTGLPVLNLYASVSSQTVRMKLDRIAADLGAVGIRVRPRAVSWTELQDRIAKGKAPAFLLTWIADLTHPDSFLRSLFQSGAPANYFGFSDGESDRLLQQCGAESDPARSARLYAHLEDRVLQLAPLVPLHHPVGILALREEVHGLAPGPMGLANASLERVWIGGPEGPS